MRSQEQQTQQYLAGPVAPSAMGMSGGAAASMGGGMNNMNAMTMSSRERSQTDLMPPTGETAKFPRTHIMVVFHSSKHNIIIINNKQSIVVHSKKNKVNWARRLADDRRTAIAEIACARAGTTRLVCFVWFCFGFFSRHCEFFVVVVFCCVVLCFD